MGRSSAGNRYKTWDKATLTLYRKPAQQGLLWVVK